MVWHDVISVNESARLCREWRLRDITSSAELRALLEETAARRRWWRMVHGKWQRGMGKGRVA